MQGVSGPWMIVEPEAVVESGQKAAAAERLMTTLAWT